MSNERGMMKWMPFKSLNEQEDYIREMEAIREYVEKPSISSDKADDIDSFLSSYKDGVVHAVFWRDGQIVDAYGPIVKIDTYKKTIIVGETEIQLRELIDIE